MNDSFANMKHVHSTCGECKNSQEILYDEHHGIIFCKHCGLILQENYFK